jgi:hypothetical protein
MGGNLFVVGLNGDPPREVMTDLPRNIVAIFSAWHPDGKRITTWIFNDTKDLVIGSVSPIPHFLTKPVERRPGDRNEASSRAPEANGSRCRRARHRGVENGFSIRLGAVRQSNLLRTHVSRGQKYVANDRRPRYIAGHACRAFNNLSGNRCRVLGLSRWDQDRIHKRASADPRLGISLRCQSRARHRPQPACDLSWNRSLVIQSVARWQAIDCVGRSRWPAKSMGNAVAEWT